MYRPNLTYYCDLDKKLQEYLKTLSVLNDYNLLESFDLRTTLLSLMGSKKEPKDIGLDVERYVNPLYEVFVDKIYNKFNDGMLKAGGSEATVFNTWARYVQDNHHNIHIDFEQDLFNKAEMLVEDLNVSRRFIPKWYGKTLAKDFFIKALMGIELDALLENPAIRTIQWTSFTNPLLSVPCAIENNKIGTTFYTFEVRTELAGSVNFVSKIDIDLKEHFDLKEKDFESVFVKDVVAEIIASTYMELKRLYKMYRNIDDDLELIFNNMFGFDERPNKVSYQDPVWFFGVEDVRLEDEKEEKLFQGNGLHENLLILNTPHRCVKNPTTFYLCLLFNHA